MFVCLQRKCVAHVVCVRVYVYVYVCVCAASATPAIKLCAVLASSWQNISFAAKNA